VCVGSSARRECKERSEEAKAKGAGEGLWRLVISPESHIFIFHPAVAVVAPLGNPLKSSNRMHPTSPQAPRRASSRSLIALAALLLLSGCARGALPMGPGPAAEPEALGEDPSLVERAVEAPKRDILGSVAYDLPVEANSWVEAELDFLVEQRREVIGRWLQRGDPYEAYVKEILQQERVPTDLYHLAMIESAFIPTARSRAGAVGLWQFMPATGREMGLRVDSIVDERMDPVRSTRAAARHLRALHRIYGDWALAAAAYNAGSGRISRAMQRFGATDFWDLAQRGDLAAETKHYVPRLYAMTIIGRDRERFGFPSAREHGPFAYDSITVEYATPLAELAALGAPSREELARLNPHLIRGATPGGGYRVWVPAGTGVEMQRAWLASDFRRQQGLGTYVVRSGDSLGRLAQLSDVRAARIRELNPGVDFDRLQIGQRLRLPHDAAQRLTDRPSTAPALAAAAPAPPRASRSGSASAGAGASAGASGHGNGAATAGPSDAAHTVRDGETLWGIARQHGVEISAIQEANGLSGATIRPGQSLKIPQLATAGSTPTEHVVAPGETLWGIARQYGTSVDAIRTANGLGERAIRPGQRLEIPAR
jgi:membrane-bound lytic murein transglycosylase D